MGSKAIQGPLWGQNAKDWAGIQEVTGRAGYEYALHSLQVRPTDKVLDIGCGSGYFCDLVAQTGAAVTGVDASELLLEEARRRNSSVVFLPAEMEELPFADGSFTVVTGFNSFQYAANITNALTEAHHVLQSGGRFAAMIWGNKDDCEAATYLKAVGSLLPAPPPGAPGPFALSENQLLEKTLEAVGFTIVMKKDVPSAWDYPEMATALKGLLSSGPVSRAINHSGFDKVMETTKEAVQPYIQPDGHVVYRNKFRVVIATK
jgi:ubiquinone/menaquinone biosynthesis C-methylase UbiE